MFKMHTLDAALRIMTDVQWTVHLGMAYDYAPFTTHPDSWSMSRGVMGDAQAYPLLWGGPGPDPGGRSPYGLVCEEQHAFIQVMADDVSCAMAGIGRTIPGQDHDRLMGIAECQLELAWHQYARVRSQKA